MGYWLKSFNKKTNPPVPGTTFTVAQINNRMYFPSFLWSYCLLTEADVVISASAYYRHLCWNGIDLGMALGWSLTREALALYIPRRRHKSRILRSPPTNAAVFEH